MIAKSYEIQNDTKKFLNYNFFLLYGENQGLKKDIIKSINDSINKEDSKTEKISFYENEIIDNKEKLYNNIYSGSLFSSKKIIIINYGTDKIFKEIEDIVTKYPENVAIVFEARVISGANNRNPSVGELSAWKHQLTSLAKEFGGSANVDKIQRVKTIDDKPAFIVGFHIPSCNQQAFREAVDNGTFVIQESPKVAGFNTLGETRAGVQRDKAVKVEPQAGAAAI